MRVVFMGSPPFAVTCLEKIATAHEIALVVSQPDRRAGRGKKATPPAVAAWAQAHELPLKQPTKVRDGSFAALCRETKADVGVVVAYGRILPREVLEAFPHGCLNVHASLLPKYRGAAPIQRAIMAGDNETGVSIMRLEEGMDTGPVMHTVRCAIAPDDTSGSMFEKLAPVGADALFAALSQLEAGEAKFVAQDHAAATHAPPLQKQEGRIDWQLPAALVSARMRGIDPWPAAQADIDGRTLKLFSPAVVDGNASAGTVLSASERGVTVACGVGAVCIRELQAPGKRRMAAADFLRGFPLAVGDSFDV